MAFKLQPKQRTLNVTALNTKNCVHHERLIP